VLYRTIDIGVTLLILMTHDINS